VFRDVLVYSLLFEKERVRSVLDLSSSPHSPQFGILEKKIKRQGDTKNTAEKNNPNNLHLHFCI